jgi:uncharacterized membrane protein YtjA (UPF0391 family)
MADQDRNAWYCSGLGRKPDAMGVLNRKSSPLFKFQLQGDDVMLKWALVFFIVSLVAGVFGFTGVASGAAAVAKILFYVAVALFLLFLVLGVFAVKAVK